MSQRLRDLSARVLSYVFHKGAQEGEEKGPTPFPPKDSRCFELVFNGNDCLKHSATGGQ